MNLEKYIHELLLEHDTVIIPGFGAFISTYKPAEINTDTNELKPPSKEVSFNQQIRNNDGLLVGSVALGEAVSHFDALKLIEKERENIIYKLDKGEKVILKETGELTANEENDIIFDPFADENLSLDSFGLESVSLEDTIQIKTEIIPVVPEPKVVKEEEKKEEKIEKKVDKIQKPDPVPVQQKTNNTKKDEPKKRGWLWLLLTLIPIIFVGIFIVYQNSDVKKPKPKTIDSEIKIKEEPVAVLDTVVQDSTTLVSSDTLEVKEMIPVTEETPVIVSANFYLVGGSFKAEENAETYMQELKAKGLEPFHLGKRGNFYIVGIGAYQTEREALAAKQQFTDENPKSGVWIMEEKENK